MLPESMFGVELRGHGGPECLVWNDAIPTPKPGPGDVIVRVGAAGVNNTDINTRVGWYSKGDNDADDASWTGEAISFPFIQGIDACGEIVAVGDGVEPSRIGERVLVEPCMREFGGETLNPVWFFGSDCNGAFAEYTRVASRHAHEVDSTLTDIELASFPCSYSTAENMLTRARVSSKDTVVITGASGGVGSAAVQLAKARGSNVIAIANAAAHDHLGKLGAARTLDRGTDLIAALGQESIDVVIDLVAGPKWPKLLDVMKRGGRYAVSGAVAGPIVELDVRTLYLKDLSFFGCTALEPEVFGNLVKLIESGAISPLVAKSFALRDITAAQTAFADKGYVGKIVLKVRED